VTAPPKNDILNVAADDFLAALAPLTLVITATFMPKYPARRERSAPQMKVTEVVQPKNKEIKALTLA
jgi:hypothetical protein